MSHDSPDVSTDGLRGLTLVVNGNDLLRRIARENTDICLRLTYDELASSMKTTSRKLADHARQAGFQPRRDLVERCLGKLIDQDRSLRIRADFKAFLERRLGMRDIMGGTNG